MAERGRLLRAAPLALVLLALTGARGGCAPPHYRAPGHHAEHRYAARVFGHGRAGQRCLLALWQRESGWSPYAVNLQSGAYGIPQALPSAHGHPFGRGNWRAQIRWGHRYIVRRYGDACAAWEHEVAHDWY